MSKTNPKLVQRVDTPASQGVSLMNTKGSAEKSLFYICVNLRKRFEKVPGLKQYLKIAYITATTTTEEQACALTQNSQRLMSGDSSADSNSISSGATLSPDSHMDSNGTNGDDMDSKRKSEENGFSASYYKFYTFSSGKLPANISCDPVTQMWKLFQQGAPLCVIYNAINPSNQVPAVSSDDLKICKRSVYDFLRRCKEDLALRDDQLFPISYVFSSNTNDLLKVIQAVNTVLDLNPNFALDESEKQDFFQQIQGPKDARYNIVRELVETERKYVQDLEIMLAYENELRAAELINSKALNILFPNLNEIVDFQRRLLVGLEANALAPPKLQRIGSIFLHSFEPFKAYEPWSVGQKAAQEIIQQEMANLERSSQLIRGELELNSFLLKPVQRLCKYPLLLRELVKHTDKSWPHYQELVNALQSCKEIANHVNEAQRKVENLVQMKVLQERVTDWKGYNINTFGDLLYYGPLGVRDSEVEREFNVYLFEQIILFFKESIPKDAQKKSKKKGNFTPIDTSKYKLELKGRIYMPNIYNISSNSNGAPGHVLTISWSGSRDAGSFVMRFKNEETRTQWETCLRSLVNKIREELQDYRRPAMNNKKSIDNFSDMSMNGSSPSLYYMNGSGSKKGDLKLRTNSSSYANGYEQAEFMDKNRSVSSPSLNTNGSGYGNSLVSPLANLSISNNLPMSAGDPGTPLSSDACIKIKLSYKQDIFTLLMPRRSELSELKRRIEKKLKSCGASITLNSMKIRYQDEEGDYIAIDSNEDWELAQEVVDEIIDNNGDNILSIWVIQI